MLRRAIGRVVAGENLGEEEAREAMEIIMSGEATPAQIGCFLTALRLKGETVEEITGFARTMRSKAPAVKTNHGVLIDTCGTGGDGSHSFNVSTAAAFVISGGGVPVAKHGNRSVSSRCGSADVLEALGIKVDLPPDRVARCLDRVGIAFLYAPVFHTAMKHVAGPRREIGIRTVFNVLGPLTNPAGVSCQVVGVYAAELTEVVAAVLGRLGVREAFVVHGEDGLDEITVCGMTKVTRLSGSSINTYYFSPEEVGMPRAKPGSLRGGTVEENAEIILSVLGGTKGPARDVVLLNAGFGFLAAGRARNLEEGIALAACSIDSGLAMEKLVQLREETRE